MKYIKVTVLLATLLCLLFLQATASNGEEKMTYPVLKEQSPPKGVGEVDAIKIYIPKDGLYKITYRQLKQLGIAPEEIDFYNTALFANGAEYPFLIAGYDDNSFDRSDYIVFYGRQPHGEHTYRCKYSDDNVYRLEFNRRGRLNEKKAYNAGEANLPKAGDVLCSRAHCEQDKGFERFAHPTGVETDFSFYLVLHLAPPKDDRILTFRLPGLNLNVSEQYAKVRIYLYGRSDAPAQGVDNHNIEFYINDYHLGSAHWSRYKEYLFEKDHIPPEIFTEGNNEFRFKLIYVDGVDIDSICIDWFEIIYPIYSEGINNSLNFEVAKGHYKQTREIDISNFTNSRIFLYNVGLDRFIEPSVIETRSGNYTAAFVADQSTEQKYAIAAEPALLSPSRIKLSTYIGLKTPDNSAQYVIISHEDFLSQAQRLAIFRQKWGIVTRLISVENIYDEFNHSLIHPTAIRDAISYFYHSWQPPQLKYVLLVGDWSWDWHNVDGHQPQNFIPTWYVPHPLLEYATDAYFASVEGDDFIPEVALARIPVKTIQEAETIVNKLINYEINFTDDAWRHKVLLTASAMANFHIYCDTLVNDFLHDDYIVGRAYCRGDSPLDVTQEIIDECNTGIGLLVYAGHGSRYYWLTGTNNAHSAQEMEYNFQPEKNDQIHNPYKTPIVFAATCFTNNFDNPADRNCIGEKFLIKPDGGALGVIASSSYSYIENDKIFMSELFEAAFDEHKPYLGDIFLYASQTCPSEEAVKMFLLLGDPLSRHGLRPLPPGAAQVKGEFGKTTYYFY